MYLLFTLSMLWFQEPMPDPCGLSSVICPYEQPEYIQEYIRDEFNKAGLDGNRAVKIVACESRFKADAVSQTDDWGYYQWHRRYWSKIIDECFGKDNQLECETRYAIEKVKRDGSWAAWSCNNKI